MPPMDIDQQRAVLTLCLMAAFADGTNSDRERAEIKRIAGALGADGAGKKPDWRRTLSFR